MNLERRLKLDSFTVMTELRHFYKLPDFINDRWIKLNLATGEEEDVNNNVSFYTDADDWVKFRMEIKKSFGKSFLQITYTSKMLGESYFDGINQSNFEKCFNIVKEILNFKIDYIDYLTHSNIFDMDICEDFYLNPIIYDRMLRKLRSNANFDTSVYADENSSASTKKLNDKLIVGLQQSKRTQNFGRIADPIFFKIYSKFHEMRDNNIYNFDLNDLRRFEFTIKNKNALKSFLKQTGNKNLLLEMEKPNFNFMVFFLFDGDKQRNDFFQDVKKLIFNKSFGTSLDFQNIEENFNNDESLEELIKSELEALTPSKLAILFLLFKSSDYGADLKDYGINFSFLSNFGISDSSISRLKTSIVKHYPIYKKYLDSHNNNFNKQNDEI